MNKIIQDDVDELTDKLALSRIKVMGLQNQILALHLRIENLRAALSIDHDTFYTKDCPQCEALKKDYEADE